MIVVNNGLGYLEVKEIVTDLFTTNFLQLKEDANALAKERAE